MVFAKYGLRSYPFIWVAMAYVVLIFSGKIVTAIGGSFGFLLYVTLCTLCVSLLHWQSSIKSDFWKKVYSGQRFTRITLVHLTCWSFCFYLLLQSPVFDHGSNIEAIYFFVKLAILGFLIFTLCSAKTRFTPLPALFILYVFLLDSLIITGANNGVAKSGTEWFPVWESCFFLIVCRYVPFMDNEKGNFDRYLIVLFVAGHMANYWAAGFAKFNLDGGPASWVLANETFLTIKRAELWGLGVPYADWILQIDAIKFFESLGNAVVYVGQLLSSLVMVFPVLLAPLTIFYDFFHLLVGLTAGVWFYKWAFVNLLIYIYRRDVLSAIKSLSLSARIFAAFLVVFAYYYSSVVHLGWYETRQGSVIKAYAGMDDGSVKRLHPQFFGSGSFSIVNLQMASFDTVMPFTQFATGRWGEKQRADECGVKPISNQAYAAPRENVNEFVQRFFQERSVSSELAISIQPYHLLVPNLSSLHSVRDVDNNRIQFFQFDLVMYCLNEDYSVNREQVLDSFAVRRKENES